MLLVQGHTLNLYCHTLAMWLICMCANAGRKARPEANVHHQPQPKVPLLGHSCQVLPDVLAAAHEGF